jgi:hypothetical protein
MNRASTWRLGLARRLGAEYIINDRVAGVLVTGSTAGGYADRFSDLDLTVFWKWAPKDHDRQEVASRVSPDPAMFYPFDEKWRCWSDMYTVGGEPATDHRGQAVDVIHYLALTATEMLHSVVDRCSTGEADHNLVKMLAYGMPIFDSPLLADWKSAVRYPEHLAAAMVSRYAQIDYYWRWQSSIERGNNLMLFNHNFAQVSQRLLRCLLALNRVYFFGFGWQDQIMDRLAVAPRDFVVRFRGLCTLQPPPLAEELSTLVEETYDLVELHLPGVDVARLRRIFRHERTFWDQPPPGFFGLR